MRPLRACTLPFRERLYGALCRSAIAPSDASKPKMPGARRSGVGYASESSPLKNSCAGPQAVMLARKDSGSEAPARLAYFSDVDMVPKFAVTGGAIFGLLPGCASVQS